MKTKLVAASLMVGVASLLLLGADAENKNKSGFKEPEVKVDAAAVGQGQGGAVTSYADVLDNVRPAVVSVYSSKIVRAQVPAILRQFYGDSVQGPAQKQSGLGSGVIISADGYILTNNHVVEDADEIKVALSDDRELTAKLVGRDPKTDVAVIKVDAEKLPALTLTDSDKLRVGDVVFAIGNPLGVGQTVTMGIVSATSRRVGILDEVAGYEDFIQTDASINRGNSGGALVDAKGRLVGINSAIISNTQGSIGIGFAIPINLARSIMTSLITHGTVTRGYLGVSTEPITADHIEAFGLPKGTKGVMVTNLASKDSPAAKAGLKRGDVVVAINDKPVGTIDDLRLLVAQTAPGTKVAVKYIRDGKTDSVDVTLDKLADDGTTAGEFLPGVSAEPLTGELRRELRIDNRVDGVVITNISPDSPYGDTFPVGGVIEQVNRRPVTDLAEARAALRDGRNMATVYYRGLYRSVFFNVR